MKVAFVVGRFPVLSETFIINQVADLIDKGVDVEVFTFEPGSEKFASNRYTAYKMSERTHSLTCPTSKIQRLIALPSKAARILLRDPLSLFRALNAVRYGKKVWTFQLLFWTAPFAGKKFDLVHCHFGTTAVDYLTIQEILKIKTPMVTSFYGYDVSIVFKTYPPDFYTRLKQECSLYFVMSNNMKQRVVAKGFEADKVRVLPVSVDVKSYPFSERTVSPDKPVEILSVGRMVEKKGFDDLFHALAIIRKKSRRSFRLSVVGGGELEGNLKVLSTSLGLNDVGDFLGYRAIEDVIEMMPNMHVMAQPSKTASNGDME